MNLGCYCTAKTHAYNLIFSDAVLSLGCEMFTKLRWDRAQKNLGNADLAILV